MTKCNESLEHMIELLNPGLAALSLIHVASTIECSGYFQAMLFLLWTLLAFGMNFWSIHEKRKKRRLPKN
ncbi:hypothetical protein [Kocuria massiliensis]|uniref:hypothetical protein n=1 Tax=Kocuria massiliensis TaxID=1926282 RepID=UPI0022B95231|nr:hypothetical protein [Kocuria massiliensis]